jgi:hypothetical protein
MIEETFYTTYICDVGPCETKGVFGGNTPDKDAEEKGWGSVRVCHLDVVFDLCPQHTKQVETLLFGKSDE